MLGTISILKTLTAFHVSELMTSVTEIKKVRQQCSMFKRMANNRQSHKGRGEGAECSEGTSPLGNPGAHGPPENGLITLFYVLYISTLKLYFLHSGPMKAHYYFI